MRLVVTWTIDKILDGKTLGKWYRATTAVPPYGKNTAGFLVHFLPGDRIRVQVVDERGEFPRIADDDPYIVQGVLDAVLNKDLENMR